MKDFFAAVRSSGGIASPNRYEVIITPPNPGVGTNQEVKDISLRCESIVLPGRNLNTSPDANIYGPLRTVVNGAAFDDSVEMIFNASPDMRERVFFEKWQHAAFDEETWNVKFYNDYIGEVEIYVLDKSKDENRMYGLKLYECYPKTISPINLAYATQNESIKINVSMNFRYWKSLDLNMGTAVGRGGLAGPLAVSKRAVMGGIA